MGFCGELPPESVAAGNEVAKRYGAFDRALARHRFARSPSYELGRGRTHDGEETPEEKQRSAVALKRMMALENEIAILAKDTFPGLRVALEDLCIMDQLPCAGAMPAVKKALARLAEVLGIRAAMSARRSDSNRAAPHDRK